MNDERLSRDVQMRRCSSDLNDPRMSAANDPEGPIHAGTVASRITFLQGLESTTTDIPSAVPRPPSPVAAHSRQHRSATFGRGLVRRLGKPASSSLSSNPYQEPEVDVHHSYLGQYTSRSNHDQDHAISYLRTRSVSQQTLFERHISEARADNVISTEWPVKQPFGHWDPASNLADKSTLQDVNNTSFSSTKATSLSSPTDAVTNANTHDLDVGIQGLGSPSSEISICTTSSVRRQSVRDLFDVYGIERPEGLVPDREPSRDLEDTPKPPRVRVGCHVCKWMNGELDKWCRRCGHRLCKDCDSGALPQANGINTTFDSRATRYIPDPVPYQEDQNTTVELDGAMSTPLYRCRSSDPQLERQSGLGNTSQYSHTHETLCKPPLRRITKSTPPGFTRMKSTEKLKFSHLLPNIHTAYVTSPFLFTNVCSGVRLQPSPKSTNHYYRIRHHHHRENHRQHHKSHYSSDDCDASTGCCSPHAEGKSNTRSPPIYSQRQRGPIGKEEESNDVLFERIPRRPRGGESEHETVECRGYPRTGHARHSSPASNPGTVGICQHCLDDCQCIACQDTHHNVRCCVHKDHRPYLHHHTINPRQSTHTQCMFEPVAELVHEPTCLSPVRSASTVRPTSKPAQFGYSGEVGEVSNMDDGMALRLDSQKSRHSPQSMDSPTSSTPKLPRSTTTRPRQSTTKEFKRKAKKMSSQQSKLTTRLEKEQLPPVPPLPPWAINANSRTGRSQTISQPKHTDPGAKIPSIPRNHSQSTKAPTRSSSQVGYTPIEGHSCASPPKSPLTESAPLLSGDGSPDGSDDHRSAGFIAAESPYANKSLPGKALPSKEEQLRASPRPLPKRRISSPSASLMREIELADPKSNRTPLGSRREPTPRNTYSRREPCQEQRTDVSAPPERKARTRFRSPTLEQSQRERRSRIQEWQRRSRSASIGLPSRKDCGSPTCEKYAYGFTEPNSHEKCRQEDTRISDKKPYTSIYSSKADQYFHGRSSHQEKSLSEIQSRGQPQESEKYLRSMDIISDNYYSPIQGRAHFVHKRPKGKQVSSPSAHESKQLRSPDASMEPRDSGQPKIRASSPESKASHASSSISRSDSKTPSPGRGNSRPESEVLCAEAKRSHLNSRGSLSNRKSHCTAKKQPSYEKQCLQSSGNGDSRKRRDGPSSPVLESNPTAGYVQKRKDRTSEHLDKLNHVKMQGEFSSEDDGKKNQRHSRRKSVKDVVKGLEEMSSRLDPGERKTTSHWFPRFELVDKKPSSCCPNDEPRPEHHLSEDEAVNGEKESREHRLSDEKCVTRKRKQRSAEQQLPFDWRTAGDDDYDDGTRGRDQDRQRPKENCLRKRCPEMEKEGVEKDSSTGPNHPDPFENIRKDKVEPGGRWDHSDSSHVKDHHRPRIKKKIIDNDTPDQGKDYLNLRSGKVKRSHHGNSRASQAYQKPSAKKKEKDNHGGSEHSPIFQEPQARDKESPAEAGSDDSRYYKMEEGSNHDSHDHYYEIIEKRRYGGYANQADNHAYDYEPDDEHDCVWKNRFLEKECGSDDLQSITIVLKFTEREDVVIEVDLRRVEEQFGVA